MKRIYVIMAILMCFTLVACGGGADTGKYPHNSQLSLFDDGTKVKEAESLEKSDSNLGEYEEDVEVAGISGKAYFEFGVSIYDKETQQKITEEGQPLKRVIYEFTNSEETEKKLNEFVEKTYGKLPLFDPQNYETFVMAPPAGINMYLLESDGKFFTIHTIVVEGMDRLIIERQKWIETAKTK